MARNVRTIWDLMSATVYNNICHIDTPFSWLPDRNARITQRNEHRNVCHTHLGPENTELLGARERKQRQNMLKSRLFIAHFLESVEFCIGFLHSIAHTSFSFCGRFSIFSQQSQVSRKEENCLYKKTE